MKEGKNCKARRPQDLEGSQSALPEKTLALSPEQRLIVHWWSHHGDQLAKTLHACVSSLGLSHSIQNPFM